jgi:hypothetical protein
MNRYPVFFMRSLLCEVWCQSLAVSFFAWFPVCANYGMYRYAAFFMRTLCEVLVTHLLSAPIYHISLQLVGTSNVYVCYPRSEDPTSLTIHRIEHMQ